MSDLPEIPVPRGSQRARLGLLFRDTAVYGLASALSTSFALVTFPLLARHLSVAEYGILDYYVVVAGLLVALAVFGQDSAVARYFYLYEDAARRRQLISQSLALQMGVVAAVGLGVFLAAGDRWSHSSVGPGRDPYLGLILLQLPFLVVLNFSQNILKWTFARRQFLVVSLGYALTQAVLLCVVVLVLHGRVEGALWAGLASSGVFAAVGLLFVRRWLEFPRGFRLLRESLPFALPYGVTCVAAGLMPALERRLTDRLLGPEELGLYATAMKVAMLVGLLVAAFQTAWGPFAYSIYREPDSARTYNLVLKSFALAASVAALLLALLGDVILSVLASADYVAAASVVFPLAMGLCVQAVGWITEIGIGISRRSHLGLYAYATGIVATFAGIVVLAPAFGLFGVAGAFLAGHVAKALVSTWLAQRAHPLAWDYRGTVAVLSLAALAGLAAMIVRVRVGALAGSGVLAVGTVLVLGLGWRLFSKSERAAVAARLREALGGAAP